MGDELRHTGAGGGGPFADSRGSKLPLLVAAALILLAAARDAVLLLSHPVAVGTDGYYYVLQVNELLTRGRLYYPTNTPLVFYLLAGFNFLTGDTVAGVKLGSVASHALLCFGVYALISSTARDRRLGLLAAAVAALSGMRLYMIAEFVKNSAALALLAWGAWGAVHFLRRRRAVWAVLSAVLIACAALCHKSAWALILAAAPLALLSRWLVTHDAGRRHEAAAWASIVALGVLPWLVAAQPLIELPAWLSVELLARPRWPVGLAEPVGRPEGIVLLAAAPLTLLLLSRRATLHESRFAVAACAVAIWSLLVTLNPFLVHDVRNNGVVGRLDHLSYLQDAVLLSALAWAALRSGSGAALAPPLLAALIMLAASVNSVPPKGLRPDFLSGRESLLAALPPERRRLGERPFVVARHGDEFLVTWALGVPAQQTLPRDSAGLSIHWLLRRVPCRSLTPSMGALTEEGMDSCSALIGNQDLARWLQDLDESERAGVLAVNPHLDGYLKR
jgi:hypothetical protein